MFDYLVRQELSGTSMTYTTVKQVAAPEPSAFNEALPGICEGPLSEWIKPRALELTYTSRRIAPYAREILGLPNDADPGPPFRWEPDRRAHLQAELDAVMFRLYGLTREEVEHVLNSFPLIRKYEEQNHG